MDGVSQLPDGGAGQPGGRIQSDGQLRVGVPGLGPRSVDAEPDHVRRLCRGVVNRLRELDALALQVALALHGLPPPRSLESGDDVDNCRHRVHDENPGDQGPLLRRSSVDAVSNGQADGQVEHGHKGRAGHREPKGRENHRVPGKLGVVQQVQELVTESSAYCDSAREYEYIQRRICENPTPCHGLLRRQPVVRVPVEPYQQQEPRHIGRIGLQPIHRSVHPQHEAEADDEPAGPDERPRDESQTVRVAVAALPIGHAKDTCSCSD